MRDDAVIVSGEEAKRTGVNNGLEKGGDGGLGELSSGSEEGV